MFKVFCERNGTEVLLTWENIVSVVNGTEGVELEWECYCGQHGHLASARHQTHAAA